VGKTEIRIGGLGGQGVILSGMIIGRAASIHDGRHATLIQAFGPEARGSACSAQVMLSDDAIGYPYVRKPEVLIVMSRDAYTQFVPQIDPNGTLLYEQDLVEPATLPPGVRAYGIPATRMAEQLGRRLVLNIVMVGFFTGVTGKVSVEAARQAVTESVPRGTEKLNLDAFQAGFDYGRKLVVAEAPAAK
jgi:2-oxoglutarate ferredoxin oxidoreductase subunit gamma